MTSLFVLGGAKSGKSDYALTYVEACSENKIYIATAQAFDKEMHLKIQAHQDQRDNTWTTLNAPIDLCGAIAEHATSDNIVLIDCLTMWLSNLLLEDADIEKEIDALLTLLSAIKTKIVFVSNEVGMGIVPDNALGRAFRDAQGTLNKHIANHCNKAVFIASGLPLTLKG